MGWITFLLYTIVFAVFFCDKLMSDRVALPVVHVQSLSSPLGTTWVVVSRVPGSLSHGYCLIIGSDNIFNIDVNEKHMGKPCQVGYLLIKFTFAKRVI